MHRHGVEQLVTQHQSVKMFGKTLQPDDTFQPARGIAGNALPLAFAQFAGEFEDGVAFGQDAALFQGVQQIGGQAAGTGASLNDLRRALCHDLCGLRGQAFGKQRRQFGRRDEIARCPELVGAAAVIALARRVKGKIHETIKADPAAGTVDVGGNALFQPRAEILGGRGGEGERHGLEGRREGKTIVISTSLARSYTTLLQRQSSQDLPIQPMLASILNRCCLPEYDEQTLTAIGA